MSKFRAVAVLSDNATGQVFDEVVGFGETKTEAEQAALRDLGAHDPKRCTKRIEYSHEVKS